MKPGKIRHHVRPPSDSSSDASSGSIPSTEYGASSNTSSDSPGPALLPRHGSDASSEPPSDASSGSDSSTDSSADYVASSDSHAGTGSASEVIFVSGSGSESRHGLDYDAGAVFRTTPMGVTV